MTPVPIRDTVGAALRFVRENVRLVLTFAGVGAGVATLAAYTSVTAPPLGMVLNVLTWLVGAGIYAAWTRAALEGAPSRGAGLLTDTTRVLGAMIVVGFFLLIVCVVFFIPVAIALVVALSEYANDFAAINRNDNAAAMALMTRVAENDPIPLLLAFLFYFALWMAITSRLYLAAPASVAFGRTLSFETWAWTKGQTLRIIGARLMLLAPAYVLVWAVSVIVGRTIGLDMMSPDNVAAFAAAHAGGFALFNLVTQFLNFVVYMALEAALSAYLFRALAPNVAPGSTDSAPSG